VSAPTFADWEAWEPLVKHLLPRVWWRIPWWVRRGVDADELLQAGTEGLLKAFRGYRPDNPRGASFKTYAYARIRWHMLIAAGLTKQGWPPPPAELAKELERISA
jgi:RNA polymerase sigma factor (sigma-70 family)